MHLMIENQGVAPLEAFTLLGDSGTRHRENAGLIGQFGSGTKLGLTLLLRLGIPFKIYCGKTGLEFFYEVGYVTEADGTVREKYPVKCKCSGDSKRTIDCGWTLEMGALDWQDAAMAIREFISNAIDCSTILGTKPVIKPENMTRAKADTTRVFLDMGRPEVNEFYKNLGKHFLHFSADPTQVTQQFLRKNPDSVGPRIYREGVFVRELESKCPSAFDYNFRASQIKIDECRNSSEYTLRATIAQLINQAPQATLEQYFAALNAGDVYEAQLDEFYLGYHMGDKQKENWAGAWTSFAGDAVVATKEVSSSEVAEHVRSKGHQIVAMPKVFADVATKMGVKTVSTVIGKRAEQGNIECEITDDAAYCVDEVWSWLEAADMTFGKTKPAVRCFRSLMDGGGECLGYYETGSEEVHIRDDMAGKKGMKVALEECAHYITGSNDCSRDFQQFFIDMIVELSI